MFYEEKCNNVWYWLTEYNNKVFSYLEDNIPESNLDENELHEWFNKTLIKFNDNFKKTMLNQTAGKENKNTESSPIPVLPPRKNIYSIMMARSKEIKEKGNVDL